MLDSNNTSIPFTLPKIENENASLEALSATILSKGKLHESSSKATGKANQRVGRWTLDEKILFLYGLRKFGKGRWKKMSTYLPDRSLVQIKSHAQKVLKRLSEGEHVFRRLEENGARLHVLLSSFNETLDPTIVSGNTMGAISFPIQSPTTNRRKRRKIDQVNSPLDGREHIIAASALCQLAAPKPSEEPCDPVGVVSNNAVPMPRTTNHRPPVDTLPALCNVQHGSLPM